MRELDVSSLNKKSPYAVEMRSERDYVFHTDHGVLQTSVLQLTNCRNLTKRRMVCPIVRFLIADLK